MNATSNVTIALVAVSSAAIATIIIGVAASLAAVVWFFVNRQNPEQAVRSTATRLGRPPLRSSTTPQTVRPGPDAEVMDPDLLGGDQHPPRTADPDGDDGGGGRRQ
jgi:hypothetical protein